MTVQLEQSTMPTEKQIVALLDMLRLECLRIHRGRLFAEARAIDILRTPKAT